MKSDGKMGKERAPSAVAVVLAAGSGKRMGRDKLSLPYRGRPLSIWPVAAANESRLVKEVVVVARPSAGLPFDVEILFSKPVHVAFNERCDEGMGSSLRAGIEAAPSFAEAFVILLADMPLVDAPLVDGVLEAWMRSDRPIVAPSCGGRRGHPVVVSESLRDELLACRGDEGLRGLIKRRPELLEEVEVEDPSCLFDVDRPEELPSEERVLIKGAGEHATATAHRLFRSGFRVVMTELERPTAVRRAVSFCTAVIDGETTVEGVLARRFEPSEPGDDLSKLDLLSSMYVPVLVDSTARVRELFRPHVIVDARISKRNLDNRIDDAPLVIGYGPGLRAGEDVHAVVETMRGHDLGRIILSGEAAANTGVPGPIAGESSRRLLSAPVAGELKAVRGIGDLLEPGDLVCTVGGEEVTAAIGGVLRGLILPGSSVREGQKIGDIDPRGDVRYCHTISDKARCISGSTLEIVLAHRMGRLSL